MSLQFYCVSYAHVIFWHEFTRLNHPPTSQWNEWFISHVDCHFRVTFIVLNNIYIIPTTSKLPWSKDALIQWFGAHLVTILKIYTTWTCRQTTRAERIKTTTWSGFPGSVAGNYDVSRRCTELLEGGTHPRRHRPDLRPVGPLKTTSTVNWTSSLGQCRPRLRPLCARIKSFGESRGAMTNRPRRKWRGEKSQTIPEEYMEAIKRPYRWMDGLLLASSAIAQKVNIVVWQKKRGKRNKIAVLRCGDHWKLLALLNDAELPGEHVGEGCPASIQFDTQWLFWLLTSQRMICRCCVHSVLLEVI